MWDGAYGASNRTTGDLAMIGSHDFSAAHGGFHWRLRLSLDAQYRGGLAFAAGAPIMSAMSETRPPTSGTPASQSTRLFATVKRVGN
jgi:hypothetical protein